MNLTFSKFYITEYFSDKQVKLTKLKLNDVYENQNLIGQYFCHGNKHWFKFLGKETIIEIKRKLFQATKCLLINKEDLRQIGYFEIPNPFEQSTAHSQTVSFSSPSIKIFIGENEYKFCQEPPETIYPLSDENIVGRYSFAFYDNQMNKKLSYNLKVLHPLLKKSNWTYHNLDGTIECAEIDYQLLFAGFFLLEKFFKPIQHFGQQL